MLIAGYELKSFVAEDIQIDNRTIAFRERATATIYSFPARHISRLAFEDEGKTTKVDVAVFRLDTIRGRIQAFKPEGVQIFQAGNNTFMIIDYRSVFGIFFNDSIASTIARKYQHKFFTRQSISESQFIVSDIYGVKKQIIDFDVQGEKLEVTFSAPRDIGKSFFVK